MEICQGILNLKDRVENNLQYEIYYASFLHANFFSIFYYIDFILTERLLIQEIPTSSAVVAFYAYMSKSLPSNVATPHHVLIFDVVRTNIGNAYHSSTGVFIVPETGVYVFIWSFLNGNNDAHSTQLMINTGEWGIVHAHSASNNWNQSTGVIVAHVNKGDDVFVKTSVASQGEIYSGINSRTMFAGWKLH